MAQGSILITGAEGFVGRALGMHVKQAFPDRLVVGTTRTGETVAGFDRSVEVDLTHGDVAAALREIRPAVVLHLAARSSVAQSQGASHLTFTDNVTAALRLAEAMRRDLAGVPLVFASSGEVYGAVFAAGQAVRETVAPAPQNAYARSKLAGEFAFRDILAPVSPVIALRLFNHFGIGQDERFVVASFAGQIRAIPPGGHGEVLTGNLDAARDFLPLADVLAAYAAAIRLALAMAPGFLLYNIASGEGRTIRSILDALIAASGRTVTIRPDPARMRPSDIPYAAGDATAFRAATGWQLHADWRGALAAML